MYLISSSKEILETKIDWKDERKIWEIDLLSSGFGTCADLVVAEVFSSKEVLYLVSSGRNPGLIPNECV